MKEVGFDTDFEGYMGQVSRNGSKGQAEQNMVL